LLDTAKNLRPLQSFGYRRRLLVQGSRRPGARRCRTLKVQEAVALIGLDV
jgi:hypothetical protein